MNHERILNSIRKLQTILEEEGVNPVNGLPIELFLFSTTLLPFVNVDLWVMDKMGRVLLTWRDDPSYGKGWHIPGGCIRMKESMETRIQETAVRELGCKVVYEKKPLLVYETIFSQTRAKLSDQLERAHNIGIVYNCVLENSDKVDITEKSILREGDARWFDKMPDNLIECHKEVYASLFENKPKYVGQHIQNKF